ncbi:MAG TPA: DUF4382 domain-containing protein, partial [Steroidobacteraceae bacterium]|nr:DUF4382 domain-containing protein [Steroidobacteraceae bacterium]
MARSASAVLTLALAGVGAGLAGCSSRTNVSATGNTPASYSHVYVTAQAVWFNASAGAGPDDGGWVKFPLSTPVTVDLVADSGGNFATLVTALKLAPGSYAQLRLIPLDASAPLASSARTLGAAYNMEADYLDGSGVTHQQPLELLNPDKGLGIRASLSVRLGNIGAALAAVNSPATATPTASFGVAGTTTSPTTAPGTTATGTTTTGTTTTAQFAVLFDAARDLTPFTYAGASAILLNPHENAYDLSLSGGIQGQLTLTNLTGIDGASGLPDIQVSAEALTADGSRHFLVASAPVSSDGSFTLYPLASNASNPTSYDLVIHGPGIATIIIKSIPIPLASRAAGAGAPTGTTNGTTTTGPTPVQPANLVSVGTLIPRTASSYSANITTAATAPLPAGAEVAFYQTLPSAGEVPYVIAASPIDPFSQVLAAARSLSTGTVDSGTYVASGATVTVVSAAPREGAGGYQVAATAPLYADGLLGTTVAPTSAGATTATPPTLGTLALAAGNSPASVTASVHPSGAGKYDHGELMLSRNGQLIASAPIDAALTAGGGTVQLAGVPGGTPTSVYYVSVRAWSS